MIEWSGLALLRPWWLMALPAIALPWLWARHGGQLAGWANAFDPFLLRAMERLDRVLPGRPPGRWLPALLAVLLTLALAGPAIRNSRVPGFRNLDGIVAIVDLSRSVSLGGGLPDALSAARLTVETAAGRPAALILYAGDAYLASAFTIDTQAIGATIAALDGETIPEPGSCLSCAIDLATRILTESGTMASDIVLISDGAGAAGADTKHLTAAGGRLSTLYVAPKQTISDMPAPAPQALAALARQGGGWSGNANHPTPIITTISNQAGSGAVAGDIQLLTFQDLGRYLLIPVLLLGVSLFRRPT